MKKVTAIVLLFFASIIQVKAQENKIEKSDFRSDIEHHKPMLYNIEANSNRLEFENNKNKDFSESEIEEGTEVYYENNTLSKKSDSNTPPLDSIVYYKYTDETLKDSVRYSKSYFLNYDENGNYTTLNYYIWEEGVWVPKIVWEQRHDSNNNLILDTKTSYSADEGAWVENYNYI